MSVVIFPGSARPAMTTLRRFRNGRYPEVGPVTFMQEEANRIAAYRTKSWSFTGAGSATAGGPSFVRWRAFIHTSPLHRYMWCRFLCINTGTTGNPTVTVSFAKAGFAPSAFCTFSYDPDTEGYAVGQVRTTDGVLPVELDADADYEVTVSESTGSPICVGLCMWEQALAHTTENGYIKNGVAAGQDITDNHRGDMFSLLRGQWLDGGSSLITWSCDGDSNVYDASGEKNVLDATSTTVTAATPGWTIDARYRGTLRRTGVPCIMRAYASKASGTGSVLLKDSGGSTLATCSVSSSTASWLSSGVFYLPATKEKYDIFGKVLTGISNVKVFAVSLYSAIDL